jgi:hypothetical protein
MTEKEKCKVNLWCIVAMQPDEGFNMTHDSLYLWSCCERETGIEITHEDFKEIMWSLHSPLDEKRECWHFKVILIPREERIQNYQALLEEFER